MNPPLNAVYFAHGKESGPWGTKIKRLGRIAEARGFHVESPDYRGMDDPDQRVNKLLNRQPAAMDNLILVGSSMGGYVAAAASETLKPRGLFLMAPAVYMNGFGRQGLVPDAAVKTAVHGWKDDVIPVDNVVRFCRDHGFTLHILDCGHTLRQGLAQVETLFAAFVEQVVAMG